MFSFLILVSTILVFSLLIPKPTQSKSSTANAPVLSAVTFSDDFSTAKGWVDQTGGTFTRDTVNQYLSWAVSRSAVRRYYIPIDSATDNIRFSFRIKLTGAGGNGGVDFGLVENLSGAQERSTYPTGFFISSKIDTCGMIYANHTIHYSTLPPDEPPPGGCGGWCCVDPAYWLNIGSANVWSRIELVISSPNYTLTLYNSSDVQIDQVVGTMSGTHDRYRYIMLFLDGQGGWESETGLLDDIILQGNSFSGLTENFDSISGFTQTTQNITIANGMANWSVSRGPAGAQQYIYRSIPSFTGDFRLKVKGQIDNWTNNCAVKAGIGNAPGVGIAAEFGYFGGGCPTNGPLINAFGINLDHGTNGCDFLGNWLWVNQSTQYEATVTVTGNSAVLSVPQVGSVTGTPTYSGAYNTLFVGLTGDGDWPTCSGKIDSIVIEPLSGTVDVTPPAAITDLSAVMGSGNGEVILSWTSPGDDGTQGTASQYEIRYSAAPITADNWNQATQLSGAPSPLVAGSSQNMTAVLPFSGYKYFFAIKTKDEANNTSTISNVVSAVSGPQSSNGAMVEEFLSSVGFTQLTPNISISNGKVNWNVSRSPAQSLQYIYRSIPPFAGDFRMTVKGQIDGWTNNCGVQVGIGDAPGSGVSASYGYFGGGCPVNGPIVTGRGVEWNNGMDGCTFLGNWLWITGGTPYTAVLTSAGGNVTLSVPNVGEVAGKQIYNGNFSKLYIGLTGDGDWPSCTGKIESVMVEPLSDSTPPSTIQNLSASTGIESGKIYLTWNAPGNDYDSGTASSYDLRYSAAPINESNWSQAGQLDGEPAPLASGSAQTYMASLPIPGQLYYFAIKTTDSSTNWSSISNNASAVAYLPGDTTKPGRILDLTAKTGYSTGEINLSWTAPGDDGYSGTVSRYTLRYSSNPIDDNNWASAINVVNEPDPLSSNTIQGMTVSGLTPGQKYYFAIKSVDDSGNISALSNSTYATAYLTPLPDLVISQLDVNKTSLVNGDTLQITAKVKNQGSASAGTHTNTLYWVSNEGAILSSKNEICNRTTSNLPISAEVSVTCSYLIPTALQPGEYYVIAYTDIEALNLVKEQQETNNKKSIRISVQGPPPSFDLLIAGMEVTQGIQIYRMKTDANGLITESPYFDPAYDKTVVPTWSTKGPGNNQLRLIKGKALGVRVYVDLFPALKNGEKKTVKVKLTYNFDSEPIKPPLFLEVDISGLEQDLRNDELASFNFIIPASEMIGTKINIKAEIDPESLFSETNEQNNALIRTFNLLEVTSLKVGLLPIVGIKDGDRANAVTGITDNLIGGIEEANRYLPVKISVEEIVTPLEFKYSWTDCIKNPLNGEYFSDARMRLVKEVQKAYTNKYNQKYDLVVGAFSYWLGCSFSNLNGMAFDFSNGNAMIMKDTLYGSEASETFSHELSHLLPGLRHPSISDKTIACGALDPDLNYVFPYGKNMELKEAIFFPEEQAEWRLKLDTFKELMTYCDGSRYLTPFSWEFWLDNMRDPNPNLDYRINSASGSQFFTLGGSISNQDKVMFEPIWISTQSIPTPQVGDYCLRSIAANNLAASEVCLNLDFIDHESGASIEKDQFYVSLPFSPDVSSIQVLHAGNIIKVIGKNSAPSVTLNSPTGGEILNSNFTLTWTGYDPNNDPLYYRVLYSPDNGLSWMILTSDITNSSYPVNIQTLPGSSSGLFKVVVSDGFNNQEDMTDTTVSIIKKSPVAAVNQNNNKFDEGQTIVLKGWFTDPEDGILTGSAVIWTSSIDGILGQGTSLSLNSLSVGIHKITSTVTDSDGMTSCTSFFIEVRPDSDSDGIPDEWEILNGLDPNRNDALEDADHEGLTNLLEYKYGTDPHNCDTDQDGMDDYTETLMGKRPLIPDMEKVFVPVITK